MFIVCCFEVNDISYDRIVQEGVIRCFNQQSFCPLLRCGKSSVAPGTCCPVCDDDGGSGGSGLLIEPIIANESTCACICV